MNVALFITCLTDNFYPRAGIAAVKVLERLGCTVSFPQAQTCCGQPMYNNGFHPEARALARRMIRIFAGAPYVVTPSASCAAMLRESYPHLLLGDPSAAALAARTYEFAEFLARVLKPDLRALGASWPGQVTYHPSCHHRALGPDDHAQALMRQIDGLTLIPLDKAEQCCGFGGLFAVKYPDISGAMARDKAACILATGAPTAVCNDAGCTMNIAGACRRIGSSGGDQGRNAPLPRFTTLAEIIAESLGLLPSGTGFQPVSSSSPSSLPQGATAGGSAPAVLPPFASTSSSPPPLPSTRPPQS